MIVGLLFSSNRLACNKLLYCRAYWQIVNSVIITIYNHIAAWRKYTINHIPIANIQDIHHIIFDGSGIFCHVGNFCGFCFGCTRVVSFIWRNIKIAVIAAKIIFWVVLLANKSIQRNSVIIFLFIIFQLGSIQFGRNEFQKL